MNPRRMPLVLALIALFSLASLGWLVPLSKTSQAAPAPSGDAAFKGKVLLVSTNMMPVFLLEKVQVQKIGDRSCLVGKGAAEGRIFGWCKGRTVRLPMEHIVSITEFDDLKEGKKAFESAGGTTFPGGYAPAVPVEFTPPAAPPAPALPAAPVVPTPPAR